MLTRREIEAQIVGPILEALGKEFDQGRVLAITGEVINNLAQEQGQDLAQLMGGDSPSHLASGIEFWKKDDALQIEVLEHNDQQLSSNITWCGVCRTVSGTGDSRVGCAAVV